MPYPCVTDYEWNNEGGHKDFIKAGAVQDKKIMNGVFTIIYGC